MNLRTACILVLLAGATVVPARAFDFCPYPNSTGTYATPATTSRYSDLRDGTVFFMDIAGCIPTSAEGSSWGAVKAMYR